MRKISIFLLIFISVLTLTACLHEHTPLDKITVVSNPTCSIAGKGYILCTDCDTILTVVSIPATEEHIPEDIPERDATCTLAGLTEGKKCVNCGKILLEQQETPLLGHTYDDKFDEICNECEYVRELELTDDEVDMLEAKNAYIKYFSNNISATEYMLYDVNGRVVALKYGIPVGIYQNIDKAINDLVENSIYYQVIPSLNTSMYYLFNMNDYHIDISFLVGKKIACIGDSVTYGVGANPNYVTNLGIALNSTAINLGTSGTSLCYGGSRVCQISKLTEELMDGADIVTIYLGINDWAAAGNTNGKPFYLLGTLDSTDTSTIYGAMKMWCNKIVELKKTEKYKNTQFYFITPHFTSWNNSVIGSNRDWSQNKSNIHGYTQKDMSEAIKTVCKQYGISVIDMYDYTSQLYQQNPDKYKSEYAGDGVHPTATCHKLMSEYILIHLSAK